jgi:hypothetical protein
MWITYLMAKYCLASSPKKNWSSLGLLCEKCILALADSVNRALMPRLTL